MESMPADMPHLRTALLCAAPLLYVLAATGGEPAIA
jgi:hypothetical protein